MTATLVMIAITIPIAIILAWPHLASDTAPTKLDEYHLDVAWRVTLFLGALITAFSVLWRGVIASIQADSQRDAVNRQTEQIRLSRIQKEANDRERTIQLLQEGAKLLESTNSAEVSVGIISLLEVAAGEDGKITDGAVELLVEFMRRRASQNWDRHCDQASEGLETIERDKAVAAYKAGEQTTFVPASRRVEIEWKKQKIDLSDWHKIESSERINERMPTVDGERNHGIALIYGTRNVSYYDTFSIIRPFYIGPSNSGEHYFWSSHFAGCRFNFTNIVEDNDFSIEFTYCTFNQCVFDFIPETEKLKFIGCRFIETELKHGPVPDLSSSHNWCVEDEESGLLLEVLLEYPSAIEGREAALRNTE